MMMSKFRNFTEQDYDDFLELSEEDKILFLFDNFVHYDARKLWEEFDDNTVEDFSPLVPLVETKYRGEKSYSLIVDGDFLIINYESEDSIQEILSTFSMNGNMLWRVTDHIEEFEKYRKIFPNLRVYIKLEVAPIISIN